MICRNCGTNISDDSKFCYRCGNSAYSVNNNNLNRSNAENTKNNVQNNNIAKAANASNQSIKQQNYSYQNPKQPKKTNKNDIINSIMIAVFCFIFLGIVLVVILMALLGKSFNTNPHTDTSTDIIVYTDNTDINLTKTYINSEENIAFNYPEDWNIVDVTSDTDGQDVIVALASSKDRNFLTNMYITKEDTIKYTYYLKNKNNIPELYAKLGSEVIEVITTKIDGVDAIKVSSNDPDNGEGIQYLYNFNDSGYMIMLTVTTNNFDEYEPIFDAILESYKITSSTEDYGLTEQEVLEVAQQFIDAHPLYERTITGKLEYEPKGHGYPTDGLYAVDLVANDGSSRLMLVDKKTGSVFHSLDGITLVSGEVFYNAMFVSNQNSNDVFYYGIKISDYLGSTKDDIYNDFGPPSYGTDVDGRVYATGNYMGYSGIDFIYDENIGTIKQITGRAKMFTYKGVTLDKNRDELVELLGTPSYEKPINDETHKNDYRVVEFNMDSYTLKFDFLDSYSDTNQISLYYK